MLVIKTQPIQKDMAFKNVQIVRFQAIYTDYG